MIIIYETIKYLFLQFLQIITFLTNMNYCKKIKYQNNMVKKMKIVFKVYNL